MLKQLCLYAVLILALTSQQCCVYSGDAPGDTIASITASRYHTPTQAEAQQQHKLQQHLQQQQQQQQQHNQHYLPSAAAIAHQQHAIISGGNNAPALAPAAASHALYAAAAAGSGHAEHRSSYNLLSEAMSQAVSNEFSSTLGSGSADGACHADDLDCYSGNVQDRLGMEAIRTLHRQLDDDDNGNIDLSESDDFLREELKYDSGYEKRQKAFHFNDDMHISVKELWEAWLRSEVHNWTMEQTTDWLAQSVQLPQYVELFKLHKVTGAALPRLAVNNMHYVGNVLGIKDPIHKQKIALKAMDVVLFGPPRETGTRWKDYILVTLLLSAIIGCWYAYQQNKNAKRHLRRMAQDMEGLQRAENSLQEMQKELERARMEQENVATEKMDLERRLKEAPSLSASSSDLEVQQLKKEIEMLRTELSRAEIELVDNCWAPPPQLQSWLQYTYELESKNHMKKRISAEKQLQSAREACEKLRKKRSSLVGAFVSTHGKSIDDVDRSIVEARNSLGEVTNELQERLHRWKQIESCLNFNIVNNNGLSYLESVLYGRNGGVSSSKGSRGRMTSSTDDLDDESVQGMLDNYSRSSASISGHLNHSSNALRDDSSGSEDGGETHSVQFYLGSAPTAPIAATTAGAQTPSSASAQRSSYAFDVAHNHIGNSLSAAATAANAATMPSPAPSTASVSPPPLPPHSNAHTNLTLNDSQMLRSQSTDLVPMEIYSFLSRQHQQQQQQQQQHATAKLSTQQQLLGSGLANASAISGGNKKMVKQHSTASQQSTSSTSSSVHSAPAHVESGSGGSIKGQSPGRWSSHERILPIHEHQLLNQQHQHHIQLQKHMGDKESFLQSQHYTTTKADGNAGAAAAAVAVGAQQLVSGSLSLQSLCGNNNSIGNISTHTNNTTNSAASTATIASSHGHTSQMENTAVSRDETASLDGSNKKRKRRLRFPFGSGSKKSTSGSGKSKLT